MAGREIGEDTLAQFLVTHARDPRRARNLITLHLYLVIRLGVTEPPWTRAAAGYDFIEDGAEPGAQGPRRAATARERLDRQSRANGSEILSSEEQRRQFELYRRTSSAAKPFFPFAMFHDTVMSFVVVCVIAGLACLWYFHVRRGGGRCGGARPAVHERNPARTISFTPRPDWYFYFLFYLLRIFKWPESVILATVGIPTSS